MVPRTASKSRFFLALFRLRVPCLQVTCENSAVSLLPVSALVYFYAGEGPGIFQGGGLNSEIWGAEFPSGTRGRDPVGAVSPG